MLIAFYYSAISSDHCTFLWQINSWFNASRAPDLLRYHIVGCEELTLRDLASQDSVVTASGHELRFSVKEVNSPSVHSKGSLEFPSGQI